MKPYLALDEAQLWFDSLINIFDQAEEWDRQLLNKLCYILTLLVP